VRPQAQERNWTELVLTGGPSAGKSSSLAYLAQHFADHGVRVLIRPEVATMIIQGGVSDISRLAREEPGRYLEAERAVLMIGWEMRSHYRRLAEAFAPQPVLIVYDRAEMDVAAYLEPQQFRALLDEHMLTLAAARDSYDVVVHLRSAAVGAPEHYTTENNPARQERDPAVAAEADERTLRAWLGHPRLWIVESEEDFDRKRAKVARIAHHALGLPAPTEIERKFLLAGAPDLSHPVLAGAVEVEIEQHYLTAEEEGVERRVRRRAQDGQETFYWTEKRGQGLEREAIIKPSEYLHLLAERDPARRPIRKRRYCFAFAGHHFELDRIERPGEPLWLLEVELLESGQELVLPDFLEIEREVTGDPAYSSAALAASA